MDGFDSYSARGWRHGIEPSSMDPPGPSDRPAGSTEGVPPRPGPGAPGQQPIPQAASLWTKLKSPSNFKLKVVLFSISIHTIASTIASPIIALRKWP